MNGVPHSTVAPETRSLWSRHGTVCPVSLLCSGTSTLPGAALNSMPHRSLCQGSDFVPPPADPVMADVQVDTCVWIDFLRGTHSAWAVELRSVLGAARVAVCGVVVLELLQGIRTQRDHETFRRSVSGLSYVEVTVRTWTQAGLLGSELNRKRRAIPSSDLVVATLAMEYGLALATCDTHFDPIAGLRRHLRTDREWLSGKS